MSMIRLTVLLTFILTASIARAQTEEEAQPEIEPAAPTEQTDEQTDELAPEQADDLPPLGPLAEAEQEIRQIYAKFFKRTRNPRMHAQGWDELARHMHDPRLYDLMFELFEDKPFEMQRDLVELFVEQGTDDADVAIAWAAVFNEDKRMRTWAAGRLVERVGEDEPSERIQRVLEIGLMSGKDDPAVASASLVRQFGLVKAIPYLIQAQAEPRRRNVRKGAIAQIVVGTQQAFVANLTPVVANNAVGYQPTIGVVSSGTVLRVMDAVVWAYRTDVHSDLVALSSEAWGHSTAEMGYDQREWFDWYENEFKPSLADSSTGG